MAPTAVQCPHGAVARAWSPEADRSEVISAGLGTWTCFKKLQRTAGYSSILRQGTGLFFCDVPCSETLPWFDHTPARARCVKYATSAVDCVGQTEVGKQRVPKIQSTVQSFGSRSSFFKRTQCQ